MFVKGILILTISILPLLMGNVAFGQIEDQQDSTDVASIEADTIRDIQNDESALDIGGSRGIFIFSDDRMLQLRIVGSIRTAFNFTNQDMLDHQTFNPFEIPTHVDTKTSNFFAGLQQTRLGAEFAHGWRFDNGGGKGSVNRDSFLIYYDF